MKITPLKIVPNNWKSMPFHPYSEFSENGAGVDVDKVVAGMESRGYDKSKPIVRYKGKILDGRMRHGAAIRANIVPAFADFEGTDLEALDYVNENRILRQNLNVSQRSMYEEEIKAERDKLVPPLPSGKPQEGEPTGEQRAEAAGVSSRTQDYAATVRKESPSSVQEMVKKGDVAVSDAARIADAPKAIQTAAAKMVENEEAKTLTAAVDLFCKRCKRAGPTKDCKECAKIRDIARKKALKKKARATPSKNGKVKFPDKEVDKHIGSLSRLLNNRAKALDQTKSPAFVAVCAATDKLIAAWKRWQLKQEKS